MPVALVPEKAAPPESGVGLATSLGITFPLSRSVGFLMASRLPVVEHTTFEHIASGELDTELEPSTQMANRFNHMTTVNARRWLFHHPDDNDVVPDTLPSPLEEEWQ